ncbi:MAG: lipopolysaccharide biosynthesis protein [Pseudonocardia sp.]
MTTTFRARCAVRAGSVGRLLRDRAAVLLGAQLVVAAVAFVVNILAARALEPSGRGELALLLQIAYMGSLGLLLGANRSVLAVYSGAPVRTVTRAFVRLLTAPSAVGLAVVVGMLAVPALGSWRVALAIAVLFAVANAFVRSVRAIAIAAGRQLDYLRYSLLSNGLLLCAIMALFLFEVRDSSLWLLAYLVAGTTATAVWLTRWARGGAGTAETPAAPLGRLGEARREGLKLLPFAFARSGVLRLDRLLLAGLASTAALGIYASVATMTELVAWPMVAYADTRLGGWRSRHDRGELRIRPLLLLAAAYCVVAALVMAALTRGLLLPLLGPAYSSAVGLILPLCAAAGIFGMTHLVVVLLMAVRRSTLASIAETVGFAVSIIAYVVLISRYDALGAAYGSVLGYVTCLAVAGVSLAVALRASGPGPGSRR